MKLRISGLLVIAGFAGAHHKQPSESSAVPQGESTPNPGRKILGLRGGQERSTSAGTVEPALGCGLFGWLRNCG